VGGWAREECPINQSLCTGRGRTELVARQSGPVRACAVGVGLTGGGIDVMTCLVVAPALPARAGCRRVLPLPPHDRAAVADRAGARALPTP